MVIFKYTHKKIEGDLKIELNICYILLTESFKKLKVKIDNNLNWYYNVNYLAP